MNLTSRSKNKSLSSSLTLPLFLDSHLIISLASVQQIGGGTFSKVFKARDLLRNKTVALKRIRLDLSDSESIKCIAREIIILRKLDHPNVIKLEGLMLVDHDSSILYLIFEYMEHDLLGLSSLLGDKFSESQVTVLSLVIKSFIAINQSHLSARSSAT